MKRQSKKGAINPLWVFFFFPIGHQWLWANSWGMEDRSKQAKGIFSDGWGQILGYTIPVTHKKEVIISSGHGSPAKQQ